MENSKRRICRKESKAKAFLGSAENIRTTVAYAKSYAESYLNYEKHSEISVLRDFDSRCISAFFVAEKHPYIKGHL